MSNVHLQNQANTNLAPEVTNLQQPETQNNGPSVLKISEEYWPAMDVSNQYEPTPKVSILASFVAISVISLHA